MTLPQLEAAITELAGHLNAAQYRFLSLVAEFDRRKGWSDGASQSCAHWLHWKCGIDLGAAREKVRVAHALAKLPKTAAAMARGRLSYSKVRALTRVASDRTEGYLLEVALNGTAAHVERLVRQYRRAQEAEELSREQRQQAGRFLSYFYDDDGSLILRGRLPAEIGAQLVRALDAVVGTAEKESRGAAAGRQPAEDVNRLRRLSAETSGTTGMPAGDPGDRLSWGARRADALGVMAESFLKHGAEDLTGGDRQQIVVHVDAEVLREGGAGRCELEGGPAIAAETARRLACDASLIRIVENARGEPLDVGRRTRVVPPAIQRALQARDRGCRFPGCPHARYMDAHHIRHWAQGGETKLSNLVQLCRFHHRQVHEGRIRIEHLDDGALRFLRPGGEAFDCSAPAQSPTADGRELQEHHGRHGPHIDAHTAVTGWRGERMDYGLAVEYLIQRSTRP